MQIYNFFGINSKKVMTFGEWIPKKSYFLMLNYIHRTPLPLLFKIFEQAKILNKHAAKIHKINKLRK